MAKRYWIVKQEPEAYSWDTFEKEGGTVWTGVRNFQARNNLRAMKSGDLVFFYHSVSDKQIVGLAKVSREHFPDPTAEEGDWSAVELAPAKRLNRAVSLEEMKDDPALQDLPLIRQSRLSVSPVSTEQAERILELAKKGAS